MDIYQVSIKSTIPTLLSPTENYKSQSRDIQDKETLEQLISIKRTDTPTWKKDLNYNRTDTRTKRKTTLLKGKQTHKQAKETRNLQIGHTNKKKKHLSYRRTDSQTLY